MSIDLNRETVKGPDLRVLLISVFIIATCGIFYELLLGSISTYFLGSSILQFSLTIGLFLFFMGAGSFISKYINNNLLEWFINIEIALGLIGGISTFVLYMSFTLTELYYFTVFAFIAATGTLVGLEIPLVARIINQQSNIKDTVANVLSFDYIGALFASIIFPLILLPYYGTMKTAFLIGLLNIGVAIFNAVSFRSIIKNFKTKIVISFLACLVLILGLVYSFRINSYFEQLMYQDNILLTKQSQYQRLVLTRWNEDFRLYINGHLQFSSADEYRYHEPFVHVPMMLSANRENILILGGGDGLAAREVLKYNDVKTIEVVDLDPEMTKLAKENFIFCKLNDSSFHSPKLKLINTDAFNFIKNNTKLYSVILIDLPDPNDTGLGKLYSKEFYSMARKSLATGGVIVTQATSPYFARMSYWCIVHTMESAFSTVVPYTSYVPSFGQWGFSMGLNNTIPVSTDSLNEKIQTRIFNNFERKEFASQFRFLGKSNIKSLFVFDKDTDEEKTDTNTLNTQKLVEYYEKEMKNWE